MVDLGTSLARRPPPPPTHHPIARLTRPLHCLSRLSSPNTVSKIVSSTAATFPFVFVFPSLLCLLYYLPSVIIIKVVFIVIHSPIATERKIKVFLFPIVVCVICCIPPRSVSSPSNFISTHNNKVPHSTPLHSPATLITPPVPILDYDPPPPFPWPHFDTSPTSLSLLFQNHQPPCVERGGGWEGQQTLA